MGRAVAVVEMKAMVRRQMWRAEVGPRMQGVRPRRSFVSELIPLLRGTLGELASIYCEPATPGKGFSEGQRPTRCLWSEKFELSTLVLGHSIAKRMESLRQETPQ